MDMIIVLKLCKQEKVVPVILLLVDKDTKVLVEFLVDTLGLTICLWVPCGHGHNFDA